MLHVRRTPRLVIKRAQSDFFHLHAHSKFSHRDALPDVAAMVDLAKTHRQPALALTDHGNMAGAVQLYQACQRVGIAPFPGTEAYFVPDRNDKKAKRYHLGLVAYTTDGYCGLVQISSYSHRRESFHHKPLIDWADLAQFKENGWLNGVLITTGCFFGLLVQTLIGQGEQAAQTVLHRLSRMGRVAVEIQRHLIDQHPFSETELTQSLVGLAGQAGLPVVATQDAHYLQPSDQVVHDALKRVVAFGPDPDEAAFPGDGFHLCSAQWIAEHHEPTHMAASNQFLRQLLGEHTLSIPELESYHYQIPVMATDPLKELRGIGETALKESHRGKEYYARLEEELRVLDLTGMAGYLLLVKEFTDWLKANQIFFQARGSAAGSMCAWLCGITSVDPIKYKLLFERFMSTDRTKPPDIDLDIEDQRREEALGWLRSRFASSQIGTHATFGINEDGSGSLMVAYLARARAMGHEIHAYVDLPAALKDEMHTLAGYKAYKSAGVNAAGIIVADSRAYLGRTVPLMGIPKGSGGFSVASQYPKDDVEALGVVKLDAMGLKNLTLLRHAYQLVCETGTDYGDELEHIPLGDASVFTMIRKGNTDGVFQLDGGAMRRGCRELGVRSLKDIILVNALYRPAVMQADPRTGISPKDVFLARRTGQAKVPEMHTILHKALAETYGLFVFQEQLIAVLRGLGFDPEDLTALLKAVKASNAAIGHAAEVIASYEQRIRERAQVLAMSNTDVELIWQGLQDYASYGFNRSHATVYSITGYRTAYFKLHHPLEFATALLQAFAGSDKETQAVATVRSMGIALRRPHINVSGANYSLDRRAKAVRRALVSIPGIGMIAAEEIATHAPYTSIADVITKVEARKVSGGKSYAKDGSLNGVLGKLKEAGALAGLDET